MRDKITITIVSLVAVLTTILFNNIPSLSSGEHGILDKIDGNSLKEDKSVAGVPMVPSSSVASVVYNHGLRVRKDIKQFTKDADCIVIGKIESIGKAYRNKADSIVYRDAVLHVENYLKNPQQTDQLTVKLYGGKIGGKEFIWEHQPEFNVGESVLLFLGTNTAKEFVVYAGDYGKFTIDQEMARGSEREVISKADLLDKINQNLK